VPFPTSATALLAAAIAELTKADANAR